MKKVIGNSFYYYEIFQGWPLKEQPLDSYEREEAREIHQRLEGAWREQNDKKVFKAMVEILIKRLPKPIFLRIPIPTTKEVENILGVNP